MKAFIQLKEGYKPSKEIEDELTKLVEKEFAPYYKPKVYKFTESLPLSHVDKVDKLALREMEKRASEATK